MDGHRLISLEIAELLDACDFAEIADGLRQQGYRMHVVRAPRRFPKNGILRIRFAWTAQDASGHKVTLRLSGTVGINRV